MNDQEHSILGARAPTLVLAGLARLRALLYPLALFGLVALGLHAGSDRLDDLAFIGIHAVDRVLDSIAAGVIQGVLPWVGVSEATVSRWTYAAVSAVDLEDKRWGSRVLALVVELAADAILVWPVLRYRRDRTAWRSMLSACSIRRAAFAPLFAPVAVGLAGVAGAVAVAQQVQLQLFWMFRLAGLHIAGAVASGGALIMLALVVVRLLVPAVRAALAFASAKADLSPWPFTVPLFIAALAVAPLPLLRMLRGLLPW